MVAARKIPRKKLKQQDEFYSYSMQLLDWVVKNWKLTVGGLACFFAILFIIWGVNSYITTLQDKNMTLFDQGLTLFQQASTDPGNLKNAEKIFEEVKKSYGRNVSSKGLLYLGNIHYKEGNYQQAIADYSELYRRAGGKQPLKDLSILGLAYSHESQKEYDKAVSYLQEIIKSSDSVLKDQAYLALARCYEAMNDKDKSLATYQQALEKFPQAPWKNEVETRLEVLKTL